MSRRRLLVLLSGLLALAPAPGARAATFAGGVIDGPSASLTSAGSLDVARDGSGGLAYVKDGRVRVSSLTGGVFSSGVAVDVGVPAGAANVRLAAARGGALVVAWTAGGRVWTAYRPPLAPAFGAPVPVWSGAADGLALDLSVNFKGYLAFHANGDVRVVRLAAGRWSLVSRLLDARPADDAGAGTGRPDIAVASDGVALVAWGEAGTVWTRRVFNAHVSVAVVSANVGSLPGHAAGGADLPAISTGDDDSIAVVAFRQVFAGDAGNVTRVFARRERGSAFDPAVAVDGLSSFGAGQSATSPDVALAGNLHGFTVASQASGQVWGSLVRLPGSLDAPTRADLAASGAPPLAVTAVAEHNWAYVASRRASAAGSTVVLRAKRTNGDEAWQPEQVVSAPALGPVDPAAGLQAAADDAGDVAVAFVQGTGAARRLVVGGLDLGPGRPTDLRPKTWARSSRPRLSWTPGLENWGARYSVTVDGAAAGTADVNRFRPAAALGDGPHTYQVTEIDRRGQSAVSGPATFRIDTRRPRARLVVGGSRSVGRAVRARASGRDGPAATGGVAPGGPSTTGSGVKRLRISFGDGTPSVRVRSGHTVRHRYRRPGRYTVTLVVSDVAGNRTKKRTRIRIVRAAPPRATTKGGATSP
jgi:PKD domain